MAATAVFHPNRSSRAIMELVHAYFAKTKKPWTLMSQAWMLENLDQWYGIKMARSTLNYNLKILREQGLIVTRTRHHRDRITGEFICEVTLYRITRKLKKFFGRLASYFKRCDWVPNVKSLWAGYQPVVGAADTAQRAFDEYLRQKRDAARGS